MVPEDDDGRQNRAGQERDAPGVEQVADRVEKWVLDKEIRVRQEMSQKSGETSR